MQMVNVRFPQRCQYGFESMDIVAHVRCDVATSINQKFTPNQIIRGFSLILGTLTSTQTLAIYHRC